MLSQDPFYKIVIGRTSLFFVMIVTNKALTKLLAHVKNERFINKIFLRKRMIELNYTLVIQAINFFVLLWVLNRFLYKPILNVLEERGRKTAGTVKEADEMESDASEMLQNYERGLREAKVKAHEERNRIRIQGVEKEREILEKARKDALKSINKFRIKIESESEGALDGLKKESQELSSEIVKRILAR